MQTIAMYIAALCLGLIAWAAYRRGYARGREAGARMVRNRLEAIRQEREAGLLGPHVRPSRPWPRSA